MYFLEKKFCISYTHNQPFVIENLDYALSTKICEGIRSTQQGKPQLKQ